MLEKSSLVLLESWFGVLFLREPDEQIHQMALSTLQGATNSTDGCKGHPAQWEDKEILAGKATFIKYVKPGRMG